MSTTRSSLDRVLRSLPLLMLAVTLPAAAQETRPKLPADADTNDASEYIRFAASRLESDPRRAEEAYLWASRLAPGAAEPAYGRFVASLLGYSDRLRRWFGGDARAMRSSDMMQLDSLYTAAFQLQPFLFGRYDRLVLDATIQDALRREVGLFNSNDPVLQYAVQQYLQQQGPEFSGWLAYTERRYADAIGYYQRAIGRAKDRAGILWNMALAQYQMGDSGGAVESLKQAVAERRKKAKDQLTHIYESSANYEYMIGWALEQSGDFDGAREAYARALLDDLSFHPAHVRLGSIALVSGDTAGALNSIATAVDIRPGDVWLRYIHGALLLSASRPDEARTALLKATELEPVFAAPWYELARANDIGNDTAEATRCYREFILRASASDPRRSLAEARILQLAGG